MLNCRISITAFIRLPSGEPISGMVAQMHLLIMLIMRIIFCRS